MDNNEQIATIVLSSSLMKFAAGHFTIFSKNSRETIHGHNFKVECLLESKIKENDLVFDYGIFKKKLIQLCALLDEKLLLPQNSPYLLIKQDGPSVHCWYGFEEMRFPNRDVVILPIENITIEALARWFLEQIKVKTNLLQTCSITAMEISVLSSSSQKGSMKWKRNI